MWGIGGGMSSYPRYINGMISSGGMERESTKRPLCEHNLPLLLPLHFSFWLLSYCFCSPGVEAGQEEKISKHGKIMEKKKKKKRKNRQRGTITNMTERGTIPSFTTSQYEKSGLEGGGGDYFLSLTRHDLSGAVRAESAGKCIHTAASSSCSRLLTSNTHSCMPTRTNTCSSSSTLVTTPTCPAVGSIASTHPGSRSLAA
eukprot:Hpha_TRINITY_DN15662_c4_g2::TRINITY_DN15662_c4_g2_i1::g.99192::m.99192